ncbi:MAG: FlgD immunoglobulin-like domain containing protein [Candidatus Zixiibacteriota bacterium]
MKLVNLITYIWLLTLTISATAAPPDDKNLTISSTATLTIDNTTFIDANQILMFVTNHGAFGRDISGVFGYLYGVGTWWPYTGDTSLIRANIDSIAYKSPLYAAGLWMGGIDSATGETRVVISEYSSEYVPGPMVGGTFLPDEPAFRNYKLYIDSLETNPNTDYLSWPIDQGAPLDDMGNPYMLGRQMLWSVYNDADPSAHTNDAGETAPLGVEVQQTFWAGDELGEDTIYYNTVFDVTQIGTSGVQVTAYIADRAALTGDDYRVVFEDTILADTTIDPVEGTIIDTLYYYAWHLENITTAQRVLEWQYPDSLSEVVDGFRVRVSSAPGGFSGFEVVANASGSLPSPLPGAMASMGFPTPGDVDPGSDQQVGDAIWLFHTSDNGGTSGGGTRADFDAFISRVTRDGNNDSARGYYDYEMRFTGSYDNPGVNGSYVIEFYNDDNVFWVPFELWQTGVGTPEDPSDDVRLIMFVIDDYTDSWTGNDAYGLESWGSTADGTCSGDCEHSVSDGDDDPFTDWIYWIRPVDDSPGESGYLAAETDMLAGTFVDNYGDHYGAELMARTVLVGLNAGKEPPFAMDYPEQGTVFRITTTKPFTPPDTFTFTADTPPYYVTTLEGSSVYIKYKLYNRGNRVIKDMYLGYWSDPDLGQGGDDFVGCDTLNNIWFCYNYDNDDTYYGPAPPVLGFKVLYGPVVPAAGQTAYFDGQPMADFENLGLTAFVKFIGGEDPDSYSQTYGFLQGLTKSGEPYTYDGDTLTYIFSGDPVTGVGDLDIAPADRRMLGVSGPFDFRPGDSQFVLIKMAVGQGTSNLNSITEVKAILNEPFDPLTDVIAGGPEPLPRKFSVSQNYPNPFNPTTTIQYALPERAKVTLDIYNILGQKVRRLVDETQPAGTHTVVWDGRNETNQPVATGLYFYRMTTGDFQESRKMILLK